MNLEKQFIFLVLVEDSVGPKSIVLANNLRNHQEGHESCNNTQTVGMSAPKGNIMPPTLSHIIWQFTFINPSMSLLHKIKNFYFMSNRIVHCHATCEY